MASRRSTPSRLPHSVTNILLMLISEHSTPERQPSRSQYSPNPLMLSACFTLILMESESSMSPEGSSSVYPCYTSKTFLFRKAPLVYHLSFGVKIGDQGVLSAEKAIFVHYFQDSKGEQCSFLFFLLLTSQGIGLQSHGLFLPLKSPQILILTCPLIPFLSNGGQCLTSDLGKPTHQSSAREGSLCPGL